MKISTDARIVEHPPQATIGSLSCLIHEYHMYIGELEHAIIYDDGADVDRNVNEIARVNRLLDLAQSRLNQLRRELY